MDMNYGGGMWEGGGWAGWSGVGGEWDNCNSIINKYILKKDTWTKSRGWVEVGEGGGFSWGGVEKWGENADNCN